MPSLVPWSSVEGHAQGDKLREYSVVTAGAERAGATLCEAKLAFSYLSAGSTSKQMANCLVHAHVILAPGTHDDNDVGDEEEEGKKEEEES